MIAATKFSAGFVAANTIFLTLAVWAAAVPLWPIYHDRAIVILVVVASVAGSIIAILGARFRWSFVTTLAVTVGVFLSVGVPLAVPGEAIFGIVPTLDGLRALVAGIALGWKQLLTLTLPVGTYQALMVPALVLVLGVSVICLSLALRSRYGGVAAGGGPVVMFTAIALGPESETWPIHVSLAVVGLSLLWLVWRRQFFRVQALGLLVTPAPATFPSAPWGNSRSFNASRSLLAGAVVFAIAAGIGVGAVTLVPLAPDHRVLRTAIELPFDARNYVSPLAGFRQYLQPEGVNEVLFSVDGLIQGDRIRLAVLDHYDGVVYSLGSASAQGEADSFTRVPFHVDQSAISGTDVSIDVRIGSYSGLWLPTVGQLESVTFAGRSRIALHDALYYNDGSGTAAVVAELTRGDSYQLEAVRPKQPTVNSTAQLTPGDQAFSVAVVPTELDRALARYTAGAVTPGGRLASMIAGLRSEGYVSHGISESEPASRSGHSAERLTQLLTDQPMVGDAEQYATAAAIMAQQLGFPARVVFGFIPDVSAGRSAEVRGKSVSAWLEVGTAQFDWVAFDVVPAMRPVPDRAPDEPQSVSRPQPVIPPPAEMPNNTAELAPLESAQDEQPVENPWLAVLLAIGGVAGGLAVLTAVLTLPLAAVVFAKKRRTRIRRRAKTPRALIVGGWSELVDGIVDSGMVSPPTGTRREFAQHVGGAKVTVLAAVVDEAVFSPHEASASDAATVWRAVTELGKELRFGLTRRERFQAAISLRSLRHETPRRLLSRRGR